MKKSIISFIFCSFISLINAQSFNQSFLKITTCFGDCDGVVTFTTSSATGPFTGMISTNGTACPTSTAQSSTASSITFSNICACDSTYYVSIFSGTVLVGNQFFQMPKYATAPLTVGVSSISPATCSSCCNGSAYVTWSGGNTSFTNSPPSFSVDGTAITAYNPATGLCQGTHTICAKDSSNCIACKGFSVGFINDVGIRDQEIKTFEVNLYPNPASQILTIESDDITTFTKLLVYDIVGKIILEKPLTDQNSERLSLDLSDLKEGLYYVEIHTNSGAIQRKKVIKRQN